MKYIVATSLCMRKYNVVRFKVNNYCAQALKQVVIYSGTTLQISVTAIRLQTLETSKRRQRTNTHPKRYMYCSIKCMKYRGDL